MTVIESRPGIEVTIMRHNDHGHPNVAIEYENPNLKTKLHEYSSFRGFKCFEGEEFAIQILVNEEYLEKSEPVDDEEEGEIPLNASYDLACELYIKGVREPQFKLLSKAMPGRARSKVHAVKLKTRKTKKEQFYFIQPEKGSPLADVQVQLHRCYMKGFGGKKIKEEQGGPQSREINQAESSREHAKGNGNGSWKSGVYIKYIDEKDNPYAIFRFIYLTENDPVRFGLKKKVPASGVLMPRSIAYVDLTTLDNKPKQSTETVDLTCMDSSDEEDELEAEAHGKASQSYIKSPIQNGSNRGKQSTEAEAGVQPAKRRRISEDTGTSAREQPNRAPTLDKITASAEPAEPADIGSTGEITKELLQINAEQHADKGSAIAKPVVDVLKDPADKSQDFQTSSSADRVPTISRPPTYHELSTNSGHQQASLDAQADFDASKTLDGGDVPCTIDHAQNMIDANMLDRPTTMNKSASADKQGSEESSNVQKDPHRESKTGEAQVEEDSQTQTP